MRVYWVGTDSGALQQIASVVGQAVEEYDPEKQVPVVFLSGCGYLTCLKVNLVPDFGICKELSKDYADKTKVCLDIDSL